MKHLVFDGSNIIWRTYHASMYTNRGATPEELSGLAHHTAIKTLNRYYNDYKPDRVVVCFDKPNNWRKMYTKTDDCLTGHAYKGNRRQNMTPTEKQRFDEFVAHLTEFEEILQVHTKIVVLSEVLLEADDLIAVYTQKFSGAENEVVIISADKDLMQLLKYDNTRLIDPATGKDRTLEEFDNDPDYFMFEKCIRGDKGDNVMAAYPGVRKTRIKKAYKDPFEYENLMNTTWTDKDGKEWTVRDVFQENILLMDLEEQPKTVRELAEQVINSNLANPGKFNWSKFLRYLGKNQLNEIKENLERYMPLLS